MAKETGGFELPKEGTKITITPIPRGSSMIKDPTHVGYFMYPNTEFSCILPRRLSDGAWVKCLTEAEQKFLEEKLKADLSFRKDNKFWSNRHIIIKRTEELLLSGFDLDISNPDGYLDYKIMSVNPKFAPSWDKRNDSLEYRFALVSKGEKLSEDNAKEEVKMTAYDLYSKIKNNKEALTDFLVRFGKPNIDKNSPIEFVRNEVFKVVDTTPSKFVEILGDVDYEMKTFIDKALSSGGLKMQGRTTYTLGYGSEDVIGRTLKDAILYLKDKLNNITYLELQARIENFK
jgi:hypothetical protein